MKDYKLEKRYRILDNGKVVEDGILDSRIAVNHIIYKVNEIIQDCVSCRIISETDSETTMKNRLKSWTVEEYYIISVG